MTKYQGKIEAKEEKRCTFRLVGIKGDEVDYEEIKLLIRYMKKNGWILKLKKQDDGWFVEFQR